MRTFKEYLAEQRQYNRHEESANFKVSSFRHTHNSNGITITPSIHAGSQAHIYRPIWTKDNWNALHSKITEHINKTPMESGQKMFYSRLKQQGYYGVYDNDHKTFKVVTVLEPGKSRTVDLETEKHIVESVNIELHLVD